MTTEYTEKASPSDSRERLLRTAHEWFSKNGFQAVGVDMLVDKSGVAKMTLYRQFSSKDELIVEVLSREDARIKAWATTAIEGIDEPGARLRAFFEALERHTARPACPGCLFQIAAVEFSDPDQGAHQLARKHKESMRKMLDGWVRGTGLKDVEAIVRQLYLLMEGSWAGARLKIEPTSPRSLATAALLIIEGARFAQSVAPNA